jgi:hypothetical protein
MEVTNKAIHPRGRLMARTVILIGLLLFSPGFLHAQVHVGAIAGVVRDTTGALSPGVTVTLTGKPPRIKQRATGTRACSSWV